MSAAYLAWWGRQGCRAADKLNESRALGLKAPEIAVKFASMNLEPMVSSPDGLADFINTGIDTWARVLKRRNVKLD